jgi:hypothetical protein
MMDIKCIEMNGETKKLGVGHRYANKASCGFP